MPIKPLWAVSVLLFYAAVFMGSVWYGNQWRNLQGPDLMETDRQGNVYISLYDSIYQFDKSGAWQRSHDIGKAGIRNSTGGLGIFSNGDFLLLNGEPELSTTEKLQRFRRAEDSAADQTDSNAPLLERCDPAFLKCRPLENFKRRFKHTFRVYIDSQDNIFLTDTAGHAVYWLDAQGNEIAALKTGLKFPNDLRRIGDTLWIANTNNHELRSIDLSKGGFGTQRSITILNDIASKEGETWPSEFEFLKNHWFVLNHESGMDKGGVYMMDADGKFLRRISTNEVDPISITQTGSELWVADFRTLSVYRYDAGGEFIGILSNPQMEAVLKPARAKLDRFWLLDRIFWYAFWVCLAIGAMIALLLEMRYRKANPEKFKTVVAVPVEDDGRPRPDPRSVAISWIEMNATLKILQRVMNGLMLALAAYAVYQSIFCENACIPAKIWLVMTIPIAVFLLVAYSVRDVFSGAVAAYGPWLLIRNAKGEVAMGKASDIKVLPTVIVVEAQAIPYRNGHQRLLFDKARFEKEIGPLLATGEDMTQMDYLRWQWKYQRKQQIILWSVVLLLGVGALWVKFFFDT